jgi:hypothetical protein
LRRWGRRRRSHAHHDEPDLGVVDPPSKRLDPVKENRIRPWRQRIRSRDGGFGGRTGAWDPVVLLLKSDEQTLCPSSKPSRRRTTRTGDPASRESHRQAPAPQPAKAANQAPPPPSTALAGTPRPQGADQDGASGATMTPPRRNVKPQSITSAVIGITPSKAFAQHPSGRTNISKDDSLLTSVPRAQTVEALENRSEAIGGRRRPAGSVHRRPAGLVP